MRKCVQEKKYIFLFESENHIVLKKQMEEILLVQTVNPDGIKFPFVNRFIAEIPETPQSRVICDVRYDLFDINPKDRIRFSLQAGHMEDGDELKPGEGCMNGKIFKTENRNTLNISFGGLLAEIQYPNICQKFELHQHVHLLLGKLGTS